MKQTANTLYKDNRSSRNVWIELFRLISVILIISTHFIGSNAHIHGKWPELSFGVCSFILISGFFGVWFLEWRTKKIFILTCVWTFWGLIIFTILAVTTKQAGAPWEFVFGKFFGGKYSSWWFLYIYLAFSLIQPFVNRYIQKFNKWITLGTVLVLFFCVTILNWSIPQQSALSWYYLTFDKMFFFLWIYSLGAWVGFHYSKSIRKYQNINVLVWGILFACFITILWFKNTIINFVVKDQTSAYLISNELDAISGLSGLLFFYSLPSVNNKSLRKILIFFGKITLSLYLTHPISWIITDIWYPQVSTYDFNFYFNKWWIYAGIALAFAIIMYLFINIQEKMIWKMIHKRKQNLNKKEK